MEKTTLAEQAVDVLVVGGGPAGVAAAFAAGRMGLKTLIVEQFNCLGGVATAGGHGHICQYSSWTNEDERVVGGIPWEMAVRVTEAGFGVHTNISCDFEVEGMKLVLERMAAAARVDIRYHTFFCDARVEHGRVTGAVVESKDGRRTIRARQVIDCTGDGDVAARAGCAYDVGDAKTGHCQPVTLMFTLGGVNWPRAQQFMGQEGDYQLKRVWQAAQANGDMRPFQKTLMGWWWTSTRPDWVGVNFTHVNHIDATCAADLTRATIEAREQAFETVAVYRKYVPGMENCYLLATPHTIGIRESRRICGEYTLTREDVVGQREFEDSIGYGSFFIDIHGTTGPGMDEKSFYPARGFKYQIPYRILVPRDVDNLLVAGRCASCSHEALGSLRVMPQCGVMGQAAGVAAALSIRHATTPRLVRPVALQAALRQQQCIVGQADLIHR